MMWFHEAGSIEVRFLALPSGGGGRFPNRSPMKQIQRLLLAATLASATVLTAQPAGPGEGGPRRGGPGPRGGHGGPGRVPPVIRVLDADHSGDVSAGEIANAPAALRSLDANGDGNVTRDELFPARPANAPARRARPADAPERPTRPSEASERPERPARPDGANRPHPVFPVMLALDADADGALSAAEINRADASLKALDANGDGALTRDELRPLPPSQ